MTTSNIYLTRFVALQEYGIPLAIEKAGEKALDFDQYMNESRTVGCLLGWWATTEYAKADGWHFGKPRQQVMWYNKINVEAASTYFGEGYYRLFAPKASRAQSNKACLAERIVILDKLISDMGGKHNDYVSNSYNWGVWVRHDPYLRPLVR